MSDTDILAVYNNKVNKLQRIDLRTGKAARNARIGVLELGLPQIQGNIEEQVIWGALAMM